MSRGPSWRLTFIDIDESFTVTTGTSDIIGYMTCRSPKGSTDPIFFPKGNVSAIEAMIGVGGANWPDIAEACAFNEEYGLFISAPPGTSAEYPSYYGGVYITDNGNYPFYHVSDKEDPGYRTSIRLDRQTDFDKDAYMLDDTGKQVSKDIKIEVSLQDSNNIDKVSAECDIQLKGITRKVYDSLESFDLTYWGNGPATPKGVYTYQLDKRPDGSGADLYVLASDGSRLPNIAGEIQISQDGETYAVKLLNMGSSMPGVPYFNFEGLGISHLSDIIDYNNQYRYHKGDTEINQGDIVESDTKLYYFETGSGDSYIASGAKLKTAYVDASGTGEVTVNCWKNGIKVDISAPPEPVTITDVEHTAIYEAEAIQVMDDFLGKLQNLIINGAPAGTEVSYHKKNGNTFDKDLTTAKLPDSVIGLKDRFMAILNIRDITTMYVTQKSPTEKVTKLTINNAGYDMYRYDLSLPWTSEIPSSPSNTDEGKQIVHINEKRAKVYECQLITDGENHTSLAYMDITGRYATQTIKINGADISNPNSIEYRNSFWYFNDANGGMQQTIDGTAPYKLVKDVNFNTVTLSCTEQVYPGRDTVGCSELQGSLDEIGTDSYGSNIYWPNVLPDDSLSFIEVYPVKTFDELTENGCYTGHRIPNNTLITLQGQRYMTRIMNKNLEQGMTGGVMNTEYLGAIKEGWTECNNAELYDCVYVVMEPTGDESLKSTLASLRTTLKVTTIISPKVISKQEFQNTSTIPVSGRMTGTAQYVGEFMVKDPYTGKKYWCQPIGDVGVNLCRIIEQKLGGWAPMWNNITGGLGGQLNRAVLKAKWSFSDNDTKVLDEKGLNPIIYNADDGVMIVSQKTTQDPSNLTDWSYLGHTMAFDLCKREIRDNVMRPQIGKPNDTYWQNIRQTQTDAILRRRTEGSQPIWAAAKCEIASVNTDIVKAARKFVIKVTCKVNIFSEGIDLIFTNIAQTTEI